MNTRTRPMAILGAIAAALLLPATIAAAAPTPPATPTETSTPAPTQTARVEIVVATAAPTRMPTPSPTPQLVTGPGGNPGNPCKAGEFAIAVPLPFITGTFCVPVTSFLGNVLETLAGFVFGAVKIVMSPFTNTLTIEPRIDQSLDGSDLWHYAYGVGLGIAGAFYTLAGLHYLRNATRRDFEPFFTMQDAVLGGLFMGGMWVWLPLLFGTGQWLTDRLKGHVGTLAMDTLGRVLGDLILALVGDPGMAIVDVFTGLLMFVFGLLVGLIRLVGVYGLGWLYIVSAMAMATWIYPPTRGIAVRWFQAICAVLLWPAGWAVSLQVIAVVWLWLPTSDPAWNTPLMQALSAAGALVLLFATPRLVDMLIGTGIAGVSGAYALAEGLIGGVVGGATAAAGRGRRGGGIP